VLDLAEKDAELSLQRKYGLEVPPEDEQVLLKLAEGQVFKSVYSDARRRPTAQEKERARAAEIKQLRDETAAALQQMRRDGDAREVALREENEALKKQLAGDGEAMRQLRDLRWVNAQSNKLAAAERVAKQVGPRLLAARRGRSRLRSIVTRAHAPWH
jgi:hypothetical protein